MADDDVIAPQDSPVASDNPIVDDAPPLVPSDAPPEEATDPAPEPQPEPAPAAATTPPPPKWMLERIGEETTKRQQAERAAQVAIDRANSLEEITRRLQAQGTEPKPADPNRPTEPARPAAQSGVDPAAVQMARQQLMLENINAAGTKEYGAKWDEAVKALDAFDANTVDFVMGVAEVDPAKAHEIMFNIAQDGERAISLVRMTPTRRIAEITRMTMAQAAPTIPAAKPAAEAPKPAVSRAPAPKPAIAPLAAAPEVDPTTPEGNEKMSDAEFERWYKNKHYKRA